MCLRNCRIKNGKVVQINGIEEREKIWEYTNSDPQIYIEFDEPVYGFEFRCEIGESDLLMQNITIYYSKIRGGYSENKTCKIEIEKNESVEKEFRFDFPIKTIRIDPGEVPGKCEVRRFAINPLGKEDVIEKVIGERIKGEKDRDKIVIVTHDLSKTGAPLLAYNIAEHFKTRGWDVVVLAGRVEKGFLEKKYQAINVPVIELSATRYINVKEKGGIENVEQQNFLNSLARSLMDQNYKTVIANTIVSGNYVEVMKEYGMKVISLIHEMKTSIEIYGFVEAGGKIANNADYIVFPNRYVKEDFEEIFDKIRGKCLIKPQGVYLQEKKRASIIATKEIGISLDSKIIMSSGSCELRKGVDLFVEAAILYLNQNADTQFIWTGDFHNEELKCWLLYQIKKSGYEENIHFIPFIQDEEIYGTLLDQADVFWGMSREDPFPSTILEAMDNKIPVVGFAGTGGIQVMLSEERGILAEQFDIEQVVVQTKKLMGDMKLRQELTKNAKAYVDELKFEDYIEFLTELVLERERVFEPHLNLYKWRCAKHFYQCQLPEKGFDQKLKELNRALAVDWFCSKGKEIGEEIVLLDTAKGSDNIGDAIIMDYCQKACKSIFTNTNYKSVPTHIYDPVSETVENSVKILCGTNIIYTQMENSRQWALPQSIKNYKYICLLGVGMQQLGIEQPMSKYTKKLLSYILNSKYLHSVRDEQTKNRLEEIGIKNVINTGCPTMWALTKEHCKSIPTKRAENVLTTVTDYMTDTRNDRYMLEVLKKSYKKVYIWIQGQLDYQYLKNLVDLDDYCLIPPSVEKLDEILSQPNIDYIGTRLYAGIRSLNYKKRSLIIAVDNRARAIASDTNLPVMERENIEKDLQEWIDEEHITDIHIPENEIQIWKQQFIRR